MSTLESSAGSGDPLSRAATPGFRFLLVHDGTVGDINSGPPGRRWCWCWGGPGRWIMAQNETDLSPHLPRRQLGVTLASPAECGEAVQSGDIRDDGLVPGPGPGAVTCHVHDTRAVHDAATPACLVPGQESQLQLSLGSWFLQAPRELPGPAAARRG